MHRLSGWSFNKHAGWGTSWEVKGADLAATRPSSGAFLRSRMRPLSSSACRGATDRAEQRQQLARPFVARQSDALTDRRCCCCSGLIAAAVAQVVAGAVVVAVAALECLRARHVDGSGQRLQAQVEFHPGSRGGAIAG